MSMPLSPNTTEATMLTRALVIVSRVLLAVALVILVYYFVVYVVYAANLIRFPFDYDQGEGFELVDAIMLAEFRWPYADIETYPFYGSIYPPLYHMLLVPFVWLFGPEYWYGRLFSFVTTLITAGAIGYAVYREGVRGGRGHNRLVGVVALLAGLAFLASNIVYHIGPLLRQHISMFMFETLAVVVLAHANEIEDRARRRRRFALGLGLLIAGGYTKQLAAFTAIAALAFLLVRSPRRGLVWGAGFALVGAAIFAGLTLATGGHWWTQTIVANVKDFYPDQALGLLRLFIRLHWWLLLPAVLMVIYELYFARLSIYSLWFVAVTALNAYAAGTWGAGDSYYATSVAAMCVLSGIFAARTLNRGWHFRRNYLSRVFIEPLRPAMPALAAVGLVVIPLLYIGYGHSVLHMPTQGPVFEQIARVLDIQPNAPNGFYDSAGRVTGAYADIGHLTTQADIDAGNQIVEMIRALPEGVPVLSEEAGFPLAAGRDVVTNPVVLMILSWVGVFDGQELIAMIEEQAFGLVILRAQFYPAGVLEAIGEHYQHQQEIRMNGFDYIILQPREAVPAND